jgi:HK97 family phage portal protein
MSIIQLNLQQPAPQASISRSPYDLSALVGWQTHSGQTVTHATVERVSAVLACLRILSEDIASCPLLLRRRTPTGNERAVDDPRYAMLHDAFNSQLTAFDAIEAAVWDCCTWGGAYFLKEQSRGRVSALYPLSASRVQFKDQLSDGTLRYSYSSPEGGVRVFLSDELWRFSMLSPAGSADGRALTLLAREAIGLLMAAEEQAARLYSNGVQSDLVLKAKGTLDQDQRDQLTKAFQNAYGGSSKSFRTLLLEGELDASRIGLTGEESQYLESRQFQLADISRIFRVPGVLLNLQDKSSTYASSEQFFLSYVRNTLIPWCRRIESSAKRDLFAASESDLFVKFNLDHQQRADLKSRYESYAIAVTNGLLTRNEVRELEDVPQLPGLDAPLTPLNMGTGQPQNAQAKLLAEVLAANACNHEAKLRADGKTLTDIYGKLMVPFLMSKCNLSVAAAQEYCAHRLAKPDEGGNGDVLAAIILREHA